MPLSISVTILTKNSEKHLKEVLDALVLFDEVLVCDTGSEDETCLLAQQYSNVHLQHQPFIGFGPTHNIASSLAKHDWILSIDSDEVISEALIKELLSLSLDRGHVYSIPRHNEYRKKWIKWCGWSPDYQTRLYNRLDTHFTSAQVHESIESKHLQVHQLQSPLKHYSYESISDFLIKMQFYSTLFAEQNKGKKQASFASALSHGFFAFIKSYFIKTGFLGGREGFEISFYNATTTFYKYLKLIEANEELELNTLKLVSESDDVQTKKDV